MAKALEGARTEVSSNAPRITTISIPREKIREVIGSGGKVIREITETTGAKIDIQDDGTIKIAAIEESASRAAIDWIRGIVAERSEEHTSELQSLMRITYAVFCWKKKINRDKIERTEITQKDT